MEQKVSRSNILLPLLEASYREEYSDYPRRNLRCSDAGAAADEGENCERAIYYDLLYPDQKTLLSSGTLALFDDGRLHEKDIRRRLVLQLKNAERAVEDPETGARGKMDNLVDLRKIPVEALKDYFECRPGEIIPDPILEIKSTNEFSFQYMAKEGKLSQRYYDQIQYYLMLTELPWAVCLIKNRNSNGPENGSLPFIEFVVYADPERQAQIRAGLKTVNECVKEKVLPPRPFPRESTSCSYCRFKYFCWPQEEGQTQPEVKEEEAEAPSQEIVESAAKLYVKLSKEIKDREEQLEEAKSVLFRAARVTPGGKMISVGNITATYVQTAVNKIDKQYLIDNYPASLLIDIMDPTKAGLEKAVKDRKIDGIVLEKAIRLATVRTSVRITEKKDRNERQTKATRPKRKGAKNANKGNKRSKKVAKTRPSAAGNKKSK